MIRLFSTKKIYKYELNDEIGEYCETSRPRSLVRVHTSMCMQMPAYLITKCGNKHEVHKLSK